MVFLWILLHIQVRYPHITVALGISPLSVLLLRVASADPSVSYVYSYLLDGIFVDAAKKTGCKNHICRNF